MGTHALIGIKNKIGKVTSIYCHWDGYPAYTGKILLNHYTDIKKVKELISLGDLSSLGAEIHPKTQSHGYRTPEKGICIFFIRDKEEEFEFCKPVIYNGVRDWIDRNLVEHKYLFDPTTNSWFYTNRYKYPELVLLTSDICKEK